MTLTYQGRLPGVACRPALPPGPARIRLDVPAFVGLAQRGPLNQPTAVEDFNQYQAIFGPDLVLAQDGNGIPVYANLPATVKAFFDNGGLRCYVVGWLGRRRRPPAGWCRACAAGSRTAPWPGVFVEAAWPGGVVRRHRSGHPAPQPTRGHRGRRPIRAHGRRPTRVPAPVGVGGPGCRPRRPAPARSRSRLPACVCYRCGPFRQRAARGRRYWPVRAAAVAGSDQQRSAPHPKRRRPPARACPGGIGRAAAPGGGGRAPGTRWRQRSTARAVAQLDLQPPGRGGVRAFMVFGHRPAGADAQRPQPRRRPHPFHGLPAGGARLQARGAASSSPWTWTPSAPVPNSWARRPVRRTCLAPARL